MKTHLFLTQGNSRNLILGERPTFGDINQIKENRNHLEKTEGRMTLCEPCDDDGTVGFYFNCVYNKCRRYISFEIPSNSFWNESCKGQKHECSCGASYIFRNGPAAGIKGSPNVHFGLYYGGQES